MSLRRWPALFAIAFALPAAVWAQAPFSWKTAAQPPVPADPLEMASGDAQPVQDAAQRTAATTLLDNARSLFNLRGGPYDLKLHFTAQAESWQLEELSPGRNIFRWTAQSPSYSVVNLSMRRGHYSNLPIADIPLRLMQVRAAIWANYPVYGPLESVRTVNVKSNGTEVTCVLISHQLNTKLASGPRHWDESESCIDPKASVLISYSPAPGSYVLYDYVNARRYADKIIPSTFRITQSGKTIIEAQVDSLGDVTNIDSSVFTPAGLTSLGGGPAVPQPWTFHSMASAGKPGVVVLHGVISPDGHFANPEVLASSDAALNQQAMERLALMKNWQSLDNGPPGAPPQPHEIFFTTLFLPPANQ